MGDCKTTRIGSDRALRPDPSPLPVRCATSDAAADQEVRHIELDRERVRLHRHVRGMRMTVDLPVSAFLGVALRMTAPGCGPRIAVMLEHCDGDLSVPLFAANSVDEAVAIWRACAKVLGLPPLWPSLTALCASLRPALGLP
jgi:hypothetical protein